MLQEIVCGLYYVAPLGLAHGFACCPRWGLRVAYAPPCYRTNWSMSIDKPTWKLMPSVSGLLR